MRRHRDEASGIIGLPSEPRVLLGAGHRSRSGAARRRLLKLLLHTRIGTEGNAKPVLGRLHIEPRTLKERPPARKSLHMRETVKRAGDRFGGWCGGHGYPLVELVTVTSCTLNLSSRQGSGATT